MFQVQWLRMAHQTPWRSIWEEKKTVFGVKQKARDAFPKLV